jgi:hypothetical protein
MEITGEVLRGNPIGEMPHLKSYRLKGNALIYICADQQSGQWLVKAIGSHRLESGTRLKATDGKNLPKPVKVGLRIMDNRCRVRNLWHVHLSLFSRY